MQTKFKKIMKPFITATIAFGIAAVGTVAATPAPAQAQTLFFGGSIKLTENSIGNLRVSGGLTIENDKFVMLDPIGWIAPGQNARKHAHIYDADAFEAPEGCVTNRYFMGKPNELTPGTTYKISDIETALIEVQCPE